MIESMTYRAWVFVIQELGDFLSIDLENFSLISYWEQYLNVGKRIK